MDLYVPWGSFSLTLNMLVLLNVMLSVDALTDIFGAILLFTAFHDCCRLMMSLRQNWSGNFNLSQIKGH